MKYRKHQADLVELVSRKRIADLPLRIVAWVVPGGGKSLLPGIVHRRFPDMRIGWFVPRITLATQAAESLYSNFGITIRESGNDTDPCRSTSGFVTTHAALMENPSLWQHELSRHPYILVIDELHHAKEERDGSVRPLARAVKQLAYDVRLDMTGTLDTSDSTFICDMEYAPQADGWKINPYPSGVHETIRYGRSVALAEDAIVPIEFRHGDGKIAFARNTEEIACDLSSAYGPDARDALFAALQSDLAESLFCEGVRHWRESKAGKIIIVTTRTTESRHYADLLRKQGIRTALAINDNAEAHDEVERFRATGSQSCKALVTCQMAYEGLDVPEATHLVCLTRIRSAPWIEQMLARVWRKTSWKDRCYAFVPQDTLMAGVIQKIREETPDIIATPGDGPGPGTGSEQRHILVLDGRLDRIRRELLDGTIEDEPELIAELRELLAKYNVSGAEEIIARILVEVSESRKKSNGKDTEFRSVRKTEKRMRKDIHRTCCQKDYGRGCEPGTHQKDLFKRMGKSIKDMNLKELQHAWHIATGL